MTAVARPGRATAWYDCVFETGKGAWPARGCGRWARRRATSTSEPSQSTATCKAGCSRFCLCPVRPRALHPHFRTRLAEYRVVRCAGARGSAITARSVERLAALRAQGSRIARLLKTGTRACGVVRACVAAGDAPTYARCVDTEERAVCAHTSKPHLHRATVPQSRPEWQQKTWRPFSQRAGARPCQPTRKPGSLRGGRQEM